MPQVDLETLVSACAGSSADQKIPCEPPADNSEHHPDSPPASFWLSGDAEFDWWDRNAVYERNESTKGNSSVSSTNLNANCNSNNNSQRFSKNLKSKAAIIGLPKPQKTSFADAKSRRNRPGNGRLFPKRSTSVGGKSEHSVVEPSSPKVSCIGRVRSKRDRNRRLRIRQRSISSTTTTTTAVTSTSAVTAAPSVTRQKSSSSRCQRKKAGGFFESVRAIFRKGRRGKPVQKADVAAADSSSKKKKNGSKKTRECTASQNDASFEESFSSVPRSLGSMNRFASGRRSESWGVGNSEIHVAP